MIFVRFKRENSRTIRIERESSEKECKPVVMPSKDDKASRFKKAAARRASSARTKPLTLPLPLPFPIPAPPAEFAFKSTSSPIQTNQVAPDPPPIDKNLLEDLNQVIRRD